MKDLNTSRNNFLQLIETNQRIIHKISFLYTNTREEKEDLFQEICLQLWKSYTSFESKSAFSTWLYKVSLNTAISQLRKNERRPVFSDLHPSFTKVQTEPETKNEETELLHRAIAQLSRVKKAIILLWLEEKSYDEIASIIGISKSNVSIQLVRIKKELEKNINERRRHER